MDFYTAKTQFNNYLKDYDCHNDKICLKSYIPTVLSKKVPILPPV